MAAKQNEPPAAQPAPKPNGKRGKPPIDPNETKEQRFRRLANNRVPRVLKLLDSIGKLSTKGQYEYTKEQTDKMFGLIHEALRVARARFDGATTSVKQNIF